MKPPDLGWLIVGAVCLCASLFFAVGTWAVRGAFAAGWEARAEYDLALLEVALDSVQAEADSVCIAWYPREQ